MANVINMPRLGLTMTEGVISKWEIKEGDVINKGDVIAQIESDKSVVPYESPESGTVLKLLADELDAVPIYEPIAVVGEAGESIDSLDLRGESGGGEEVEAPKEAEKGDTKAIAAPAKVEKIEGRIFASPAAKRVAREQGIDISEIPLPEGKARIEKADVLAYAENRTKVKATPLAKKMADEQGIDLTDVEASGNRIYSADVQKKMFASQPAEDVIIPVTGMRKVIAARMKESLDTAAHLTTVIDVDMTEIIKVRETIKDDIQEKYDVKISYNDIILKCVAAAIEEYPRVNCRFTETEITQFGRINLGMAVAIGEGLVVPVIKDANYLSMGQIAGEAKRLALKAKDTGLAPDDMSGGTFTVSNLGMYGITSFTSIINQPESAILSVGGMIKKPVVIDDEIVIRPMVTLTLSYDHRAMDGSMSAIFLKKLKDIMEAPYRMMI